MRYIYILAQFSSPFANLALNLRCVDPRLRLDQRQWRGNYFWTRWGGQDRERQNWEREIKVFAVIGAFFCPDNKRSLKEEKVFAGFGAFVFFPKNGSGYRCYGGKNSPWGGKNISRGAAAPLLPAPMINVGAYVLMD